MHLFLIRHGQSANNALPESQRSEDPSLTELGWRQAEAIGSWGPEQQLTKVLVSPFRRTLETAQPLAQSTQHRPEVWIDLHERGGCYAGYDESTFRGCPGMTGAQIQESFPTVDLADEIGTEGWWRSQPRETDPQAIDRAERLIERFRKTFQGSSHRVACVMHADIKAILVARLLARIPDPTSPSPYLNASVTTLRIDDQGRFELVRDNCVRHLPDDHHSA